jgi:uncharacterized protein (DUF58 family)
MAGSRTALRIRLTHRGAGLLTGGIVVAILGLVFGMSDVIALGAAGIFLVGGSALWMAASRLDRGRGALTVTRRIQPNPAIRGQETTTTILVRARRPSAAVAARLARLRLGEQAAHELCDASTQRARISTDVDRISIRYTVRPRNRGRWALGPLLASRLDVFGVIRADQELGPTDQVAVWPQTVDLQVRARGAFGDHERTGSGARLASTEDTTLREYVAGDDPRRVHWASAARRGYLVVRADESGGLPPVTVIIDDGLLPHRDRPDRGQGEWAIECAASIAVSLARAGHPVRLLGTQNTSALQATGFVTGRGQEASAGLLNATLDMWGHPSPADADRATTQTLRALRRDRVPGEVTVAVLGPLSESGREAAAAVTIDSVGWAVVVDDQPAALCDTHETADHLRVHGWRVATCAAMTPVEKVWLLLTEGAK